MRRKETKVVKVVMKMNVEEKRRRGRLKKRWLDMIENHKRAVSVCVGNVKNQDEWKL
jgi:hypothetical protein